MGTRFIPKPEDWLQFAKNDLKAARALLVADEGLLSSVFYHIQQGIEKALKGYLLFKQVPIRKTHDLVRLAELCTELDIDFSIILNDAKDINPYSTVTRYPDDYYALPSLDTAHVLLSKAEGVYTFVEAKIFAIY